MDQDTITFLQAQYHELDRLTAYLLRKSKKTGYSQQLAAGDLNKYMNVARAIFLVGMKDSDEKQFVSDLIDLMNAVAPIQDETVAVMTQGDYADWKLSKEDILRQRESEFRARKQLQKSAQKLYDRTDPKTYRQLLMEAICDGEKLIHMGNALQSFYEDTEGSKLRDAYEALVKKAGNGHQRTESSKWVLDFTDAMIRCLTERAKKMESIIIHINAEDASTDTDTVAWRLFQSRLFAVVFPS